LTIFPDECFLWQFNQYARQHRTHAVILTSFIQYNSHIIMLARVNNSSEGFWAPQNTQIQKST
jgi:hypothetical protein